MVRETEQTSALTGGVVDGSITCESSSRPGPPPAAAAAVAVAAVAVVVVVVVGVVVAGVVDVWLSLSACPTLLCLFLAVTTQNVL